MTAGSPLGKFQWMEDEARAAQANLQKIQMWPDLLLELFAAVRESQRPPCGSVIDRVTDLFEKWAEEESEHRAAGEFGIAEGLHVAIDELREAVHGGEVQP